MGADGLVVSVRVDEPGRLTGLGEKMAVTPLPNPEALKVKGEFWPLIAVVEMDTLREELWPTLT